MRATESDSPWFAGQMAAVAGGFIAIGIYAGFQEKSWVVFACCALLALAAHLSGALLGFIFGIPRTVAATASDSKTTQYVGNTNLEQISDWLTKILVGAGLVQLGKIGDVLDGMTQRLDKHGCLGSCGNVVAPTIVILFSISGFLLAYLYARIYLAKEFRRTDEDDSPDTILGKMAALLYKPNGYIEVIQIGDDMLKLGSPSDARFWVYYACAYGQKAKADKGAARNEDFTTDHDKALEAVRNAIAMDATKKPLLQSFWRPAPGATDDDLAVFSDNDDFAAVLS